MAICYGAAQGLFGTPSEIAMIASSRHGIAGVAAPWRWGWWRPVPHCVLMKCGASPGLHARSTGGRLVG